MSSSSVGVAARECGMAQRPSDILAPPDPFELPGAWQDSTDAASGTLRKYINLVPSAVMQVYCERQPTASSLGYVLSVPNSNVVGPMSPGL
jgi:hypothetical protein